MLLISNSSHRPQKLCTSARVQVHFCHVQHSAFSVLEKACTNIFSPPVPHSLTVGSWQVCPLLNRKPCTNFLSRQPVILPPGFFLSDILLTSPNLLQDCPFLDTCYNRWKQSLIYLDNALNRYHLLRCQSLKGTSWGNTQ